MSQSTNWDERLNGENGFCIARFVFAALVVLQHSYFLPFNSIQAEPLFILSEGRTDFGSLAVNGFFAISGFLITRSCLLTNNGPRYFKKRIGRIVPAFLLASLLNVLVFGPLGADDVGAFFRDLDIRATAMRMLSLHQSGMSGTLLHNPMKSVIDGTLWTIKYEFDCYVLVALLWGLGLLRPWPVAAIFIGFMVTFVLRNAGVVMLPGVDDDSLLSILISSPNNWPRLFTYFFAGATFYLWRDIIPKSTVLFAVSALILALGIGCGGARIAMLTAGVYCLFFITLSAGRSLRLFGSKVDLSYGMFLFGFPIQQLIIANTQQPMAPELLLLLSLPLTCGIAYLSWTLIESPSLRWAHGVQLTRRHASELQ
jgi:peptidoglycan/LPS O-acetylase OafA/YrhL